MSNDGITSFAPADGKALWKQPGSGVPIVQPARITENDILIVAGEGKGLQRIAIKNGSGGWNLEKHWTSNRLRPYFNDFIIHKGYVYGFEGPSLVCIDIEEGINAVIMVKSS